MELSSSLRRKSHHDVELCRQFSDARAFDGRKIHGDRGARLGIFDSLENTVALILRLALNVALRGPFLAALHFDREVNVPGAPGIKHRLDGAEIVFAAGAGEEAAKALEVLVARRVSVAAVQIDAVVVHLPDFDQGVADGRAARIEDAAAQVGDLADGRSDAVVDDDQVVVRVERQVIRIERAFGLPRRAR